MPWPNLLKTVFTANVTLPLATETVVATVAGVSARSAGPIVNLRGWAQVATGVGATTVTPRLRRGVDATGTLVGLGTAITVTASSTIEVVVEGQDTPPEVASQSYVLTLTAAGVAGTANQGSLEAEVL